MSIRGIQVSGNLASERHREVIKADEIIGGWGELDQRASEGKLVGRDVSSKKDDRPPAGCGIRLALNELRGQGA